MSQLVDNIIEPNKPAKAVPDPVIETANVVHANNVRDYRVSKKNAVGIIESIIKDYGLDYTLVPNNQPETSNESPFEEGEEECLVSR